jgi:large subunit ribosomal protein L25
MRRVLFFIPEQGDLFMARQNAEFKAAPRERVGKGAARAVRRKGMIPAVIYGNKQPPDAIALDYKDLSMQVQSGAFLSTVYTIELDGEKQRVLPRDVQFDIVRDTPLHVDFLRIGKDARVNVDIPVNFINETASPGLKMGGVLNVVRHEVELECMVDAIPEAIDVDLAGREIGDSIHISEVALPEGTAPTVTDRDFTIATIAGVTEKADVADSDEDEGTTADEAGDG